MYWFGKAERAITSCCLVPSTFPARRKNHNHKLISQVLFSKNVLPYPGSWVVQGWGQLSFESPWQRFGQNHWPEISWRYELSVEIRAMKCDVSLLQSRQGFLLPASDLAEEGHTPMTGSASQAPVLPLKHLVSTQP